MEETNRYDSWGHYPKAKAEVTRVDWRSDPLPETNRPLLPYGMGRSYGDSCLNDGGVLLRTTGLDRFVAFDRVSGLLTAEAGVSLEEILELIVPAQWFLPVSPGTKFVTLGGAIANDIHGKNHHRAGTFGSHVESFDLLRSDGTRLRCSPKENAEMFAATIGGLGLTGLILTATIRLQPIQNPYILNEALRFHGLEEFLSLSDGSEADHQYTVAWLDCVSRGKDLGRGIFFRGNHAASDQSGRPPSSLKKLLVVPFSMPGPLLNRLSMTAFNATYFHAPRPKRPYLVHYDPFFYPLDSIKEWRRMYGKSGFLQYQFVVPRTPNNDAFKAIFDEIVASGNGSFLAVLKTFGKITSPGMLSFPRPGLTLALDFPNRGERIFSLFSRLDSIVTEAGGAVYPAKDARMSPQSFQSFFPALEKFTRHIDPKFSSSFWRRVTL